MNPAEHGVEVGPQALVHPGRVLVLGTGGTIAGAGDSPLDNVSYRAGRLGVDALVRAVPPLSEVPLVSEQLFQVDSCDMGFEHWTQLLHRVDLALQDPTLAGIVITHGTDTLEETAYLLHRLLRPARPVVLTAAMRPATSLAADGPQNLLDAVTVARCAGAQGVLAVLDGVVHAGRDVRKAWAYRRDAFDSGDAGPVARVEEGQVRVLRPWPSGDGLGVQAWPTRDWPWVEIITSAAGADGRAVRALVAAGVQGLVLAGTGNATLRRALLDALLEACSQGVAVWRASRAGPGPIWARDDLPIPGAGLRSPVQARIDLLLSLGQAAS